MNSNHSILDSLTMAKICELVERESGVHLDQSKEYLLKSRLADYLSREKFANSQDVYQQIQSSRKHLQSVIELLTTNETYWFRDESLWQLLQNKILPDLLQQIKTTADAKIKIWCAATSTGQEPYSLAISLHDCVRRPGLGEHLFHQVEIIATDISVQNLEVARKGIYTTTQVERGAQERLLHCFDKISDREFRIKQELAKIITFRQLNLMTPFQHEINQIDLILCRNVAIYFSDENKKELYKRLHQSLKDDGLLVMGSTEAIWDNQLFVQENQYKNLCYKKKKMG